MSTDVVGPDTSGASGTGSCRTMALDVTPQLRVHICKWGSPHGDSSACRYTLQEFPPGGPSPLQGPNPSEQWHGSNGILQSNGTPSQGAGSLMCAAVIPCRGIPVVYDKKTDFVPFKASQIETTFVCSNDFRHLECDNGLRCLFTHNLCLHNNFYSGTRMMLPVCALTVV